MRTLYPEIAPFDSGYLKVSDLHTLYYEQAGNPEGKPVVFLHGGPGGGLISDYRRYFDPQKWRVILFDQRGCGKSTPFAELKENTTWDLVADIERLRAHLGIDRWAVFGGSWGSTLALSYAITHPEACLELFLRGIFLLRKKEIDWFYQEGCSKIFPDIWQAYRDHIPPEERQDMVSAYYRRLTSSDSATRQAAAVRWSVWEGSTSRLLFDAATAAKFGDDAFAEAFARIECHYFVNRGFFSHEDYLLDNIGRIRHLRTVIIHGRYDVVCPVENAWELKQVFPEAELHIIADAGHALAEQGTTDKMITYTDQWSD